jgi:tyrosine-protein phosphatase SIW14
MKFRLITPLFASSVFFVGVLAAQVQPPAGVPNFHQLNNNVYRGAQPSDQGLQNLAHIGIKTVIDLRESGGRSEKERRIVEGAGMRYISIPMSGHSAPSDQEVTRILTIFTDPTSGPVFIHCRRGADRTGTVIACYRISHDHWGNQQALEEAKANGMSWTEMAMKHFVLGYKAHTESVAAAPAAAPGSAQ